MQTRVCRQCGELKPIESFRKYYSGRQGYYTICKACERINSRAKYLRSKGDSISRAEETELQKIERLYEAQRACGLRPPRSDAGRDINLVDSLDSLIASYTKRANKVKPAAMEFDTTSTPSELLQWLSAELTEEPEYYIDEVYEGLLDKYKPIIRIDSAEMLPVYDETYSTVLGKILDRFNKYEDDYYNQEEQQ